MRPVDLAPDDDPPPVLLLPALPRHYHTAPWLAPDWVRHGETQLRGFQLFAVEQRMTDRHALMPVIVVLTGDKADCITVERFELRRAASFDSDERAIVWTKTKAVLKHAGTRVNQTPQGHIPLTALPSLPPSLSLVQLPPIPLPFRPSTSTDSDPPLDAADYRHHEPLLIQNINLRRLGLGGRAGFRLPPSASGPSSSSKHAPHALALFGLGPVKAYLASSVVRVVQARRLDSARVAQGGERAPYGDGSEGMLDRDTIERALLEALLDGSAAAGAGSAAPTAGSSTRVVPPPSPGVELVLEDWAEALGLPLPSASTSSAPDAPALAAAGLGAGPTLLEGDGLLCDTTVAALSVFRLAYAERFVASAAAAGAGARAGSGSGESARAGVGAGASRLLDDDGSLLPPALLAALLSLVVATRGKMVVLGGITGAGAGEGGSAAAGAAGGIGSRAGTLRRKHGAEERRERDEGKVPKDPLAKRERFLRCVEAFQRSHPSAFQHVATSSSCPPVLTPSFLAALSTLYASRHSPATSLHSHPHAHSHLPHLPTARVRGALSSALGSVLHPDRDRDSPSTAPSDADTPSHSEHERNPHRRSHQQQQQRRRSTLPHPLTALHLPFGSRTRGGRGEHAETLDLEGFVRAYVLGDDEGEADDGGGRGARARVRRRRRRARGAGRAGASVRGLWDPEEEDDRPRDEVVGGVGEGERSKEVRRDEGEAATDAESVYTARTGATVQQQQYQAAPASAPHAPSSSSPPAHGSTPASSSSVSTGPVKFGRGVLRGVKEVAGRAGRKLGDELGLGSAEAAGEGSDGRRTALRDEADEKEREGLGPPLVVVSASSRSPSPNSSVHPSLAFSAPLDPSASASRAATLSSRLSAALSLPSSAAPSPSHSRTQSPRGSTTSAATHRALPSLQTDVAPSSVSAHASPVSAGGTSSPGGAAKGRSQLSLGLSVPGDRRSARGGAPPMRRAVSETHPRKASLLLGGEGEGVDERAEPDEGRGALEESLLFGAEEGGSATDDEGPEGFTPLARARGDDSATEDDGDGDEGVYRRPSGLVVAPRVLTRRHSINLVDDAPEPVVWLSRRTLEVDMNLRATAWAFKVKQKKLEDMVAAMEAIQRAYDQALSSLAGPLAHKTAQLDALTATAAQLTTRLEAYSASSSPLSLLSTGTSRLQYAQAVLDDKLRDVVDFDRALDDKVRAGDGTLEVAVRELERDMGVMRKVLGVLESGSAWAWSK
ncbi:uncharacterized protein RHOBADRAFT_56520, partial [Rhodotorula graminis WP1]